MKLFRTIRHLIRNGRTIYQFQNTTKKGADHVEMYNALDIPEIEGYRNRSTVSNQSVLYPRSFPQKLLTTTPLITPFRNSQRYEEWKTGLPDMKWMKDVLPDEQQWAGMQRSLMSLRDSVKNSIDLDPRLKQLGDDKMSEWRRWFDSRLDDAIEAAAATKASASADGAPNGGECCAGVVLCPDTSRCVALRVRCVCAACCRDR